jgi:hypothetical protein
MKRQTKTNRRTPAKSGDEILLIVEVDEGMGCVVIGLKSSPVAIFQCRVSQKDSA